MIRRGFLAFTFGFDGGGIGGKNDGKSVDMTLREQMEAYVKEKESK